MSSAELSRFLDDLRNDPQMLEESRTLLRDPEAALRWAREKGYHLTLIDIQELLASDQELSDEDLDQAAGGTDTAWPPV